MSEIITAKGQGVNTDAINFNSGVVKLKVSINTDCPISQPFLMSRLSFNPYSLKTIPSSLLTSTFGYVEGEDGLFLKPKYVYRSNLLRITSPKGGGDELPLGGSEDEDRINEIFKDAPREDDYRKEFTFYACDNLFGDSPVPPSMYDQSSSESSARWSYSYAAVQPSSVNPKDAASENPYESPIGQVLFLTQSASYFYNGELSNDISSSSYTSAYASSGIHWSVRKKEELFWGEDFFIEFRRIVEETCDAPNIDGNNLDKKHKFIDVQGDGGSDKNYQNSDGMPVNQAVVVYDRVRGEDGKVDEWKKQENTADAYNFNKQPYIIIALTEQGDEHGPLMSKSGQDLYSGGNYYIIIPNNASPLFVKVEGGISFSLSQYDSVIGSALWKEDKFRITVRHHLGRMVVTFDGLEDKPWVIENFTTRSPSSGVEADPNIMQIGYSKLYIYGGNLAVAFNFGILQYSGSASLTLPIATSHPTLEDADPENAVTFTNKYMFSMPDFGDESETQRLLLLSEQENGICFPNQWSTKKTENGEYKPVSWDKFSESRDPYYYCDAQEVNEFAISGPSIKARRAAWHHLFTSVNGKPEPYFLKEISEKGGLSKISLAAKGAVKTAKNMLLYNVEMRMTAGGHEFGSFWICPNCKTPVITSITMYNIPDGDSRLWTDDNAIEDIADYVLDFSDNWSAGDYFMMEHTGTIKFYAREGTPRYNEIISLRNRNFYITVDAGYEGCNYVGFAPGEMRRIFTGIGIGGEVIENAGSEKFLVCKLVDYTYILKNTVVFNSPIFDGLDDRWAIWQIAKICQIRDGDGGPAEFIKQAALAGRELYQGSADREGDIIYSDFYQLSDSLAGLNAPFFQFKQFTKWGEGVHTIAQKSGKCFFFDNYGRMRYETLLCQKYAFNDNDNGQATKNLLKEALKRRNYTRFPGNDGQLAFNSITRESTMESVYNNIWLWTSSPYRESIFGNKRNWPGMTDPSVPGFIGFERTNAQADGIFGGWEELKKVMKHYQKMTKPPLAYRFESYGIDLRAAEAVAWENCIPLAIVSVSNHISKQENKWWQTIEADYVGG